MQTLKWERRIIIIAGIVLVVFVILVGLLVSQWIAPSQHAIIATPTPTPTDTPTSTDTPIPTDTPVPSPTPVPFVSGVAEYLIDVQSGHVLYSANVHARLPIASVTKIMTAIVTIQQADITQVIPVTQAELAEVPAGASVAGLVAGDKIRLSDLLYALMLPSGCDAAIVIAHAVAGSTASFVARMNAEAQTLGLHDTHYTSPHGAISDPNHYSSVADQVALARYAMNNATFAQIVGTQSYELKATINHHDYPWQNTNQLLGMYAGANGVKTGSSPDAGYCLVFSATRNGRLLIGAEFGAPGPDSSTLYHDVINMLNLGFSR